MYDSWMLTISDSLLLQHHLAKVEQQFSEWALVRNYDHDSYILTYFTNNRTADNAVNSMYDT